MVIHAHAQPDLMPLPAVSTDQEEQILYQGPISICTAWFKLGTCLLAGLAGAALLLYSFKQEPGTQQQALLYGGAALALLAGLFFLMTVIDLRTTRYKFTTRLIEIECGLVMKSVESIPLLRVKDVRYAQSMAGRMFGYGTIQITSTVPEDPLLELVGIPKPRFVYERLRDAMIYIGQRRGLVNLG